MSQILANFDDMNDTDLLGWNPGGGVAVLEADDDDVLAPEVLSLFDGAAAPLMKDEDEDEDENWVDDDEEDWVDDEEDEFLDDDEFEDDDEFDDDEEEEEDFEDDDEL